MQKYTNPPLDFDVFKSNVCHMVKDKGDLDFIIELLQADDIRTYWNQKQYFEALYLLAMHDYLSRINEIPLCTRIEKFFPYGDELNAMCKYLDELNEEFNLDKRENELVDDAEEQVAPSRRGKRLRGMLFKKDKWMILKLM